MTFFAIGDPERFRGAFRDIGENVTSLGSQVGGVADQVADWLRNRGGSPGDSAPAPDDEA